MPAPVSIEGPVRGQGRVCEQILRALPDWFGDLTAARSYVKNAESLQSFVACITETTVGILTFKLYLERAAEIVVMGVLPEYHRRGIGSRLHLALESHLRNRNVEYLQVKTLDDSAESAAYKRTREFYDAMGFVPLEMWSTVWSPGNPCLQLVKRVSLK